MTARPITLHPWQVRAALDGRLRRIVAPLRVQPEPWAITVNSHPGFIEVLGHKDGYARLIRAPYAPGDMLYGRETWAHVPRTAYAMSDGVEQRLDATDPDMAAVYKAGWERCAPRWRSPVTMPRWASRWTLTVGEVAVIRARDVGIADAEECGTEWATGDHSRKESFARQFNTDHPGAWERNDWCVSASVETRRGNVDA